LHYAVLIKTISASTFSACGLCGKFGFWKIQAEFSAYHIFWE